MIDKIIKNSLKCGIEFLEIIWKNFNVLFKVDIYNYFIKLDCYFF